MDRFDVQRLRDYPVEEAARRLGLEVSRHKALCPFHPDRHPSLMFHVQRNIFRCFVCGAHGNTIDLVMRLRGCSFLEACSWLSYGAVGGGVSGCNGRSAGSSGGSGGVGSSGSSGGVGVTGGWGTENRFPSELSARERAEQLARLEVRVSCPVLTEEARRFLFTERRLHPAVVKWLGISSTHRELLIPYRDTDGRLLTLQRRYLGSDKEHPRFIFPKGMSCELYNLPVLERLREGDDLYFSEGVTDCMALLSAGHKTIAVPSATSFAPCSWQRVEEVLERLPSLRLHMYPDRDEPGERLFAQLRIRFPSLVRHSLPDGCKDFGDFYRMQQQCPTGISQCMNV